MTLPITTFALGLVLSLGVLVLVRKGELHGRRAAGWMVLAVLAFVGALMPGLTDWIGLRLGVSYPPMLVALIGLVALTLKALAADVEASGQERRLRRLTQRIALLEVELYGRRPVDVQDEGQRPADAEP